MIRLATPFSRVPEWMGFWWKLDLKERKEEQKDETL